MKIISIVVAIAMLACIRTGSVTWLPLLMTACGTAFIGSGLFAIRDQFASTGPEHDDHHGFSAQVLGSVWAAIGMLFVWYGLFASDEQRGAAIDFIAMITEPTF